MCVYTAARSPPNCCCRIMFRGMLLPGVSAPLAATPVCSELQLKPAALFQLMQGTASCSWHPCCRTATAA